MSGYLGAYHDHTGFSSGLLLQVGLEFQEVRVVLLVEKDIAVLATAASGSLLWQCDPCDVKQRLPHLLKPYKLNMVWGYKYDQDQAGISLHCGKHHHHGLTGRNEN